MAEDIGVGKETSGSSHHIRADSAGAWRVAFGGFLAQFLTIGYARSSSLMLLALSDDYDLPKAIILPTLVLSVALDKMLSPIAERFSALMGARVALYFSGTASFLCLLCIFLVPINAISVITLLGAALGVFSSFTNMPIMSVVSIAFQAQRGMAMAFVKAGVSLGSICMPPLFVWFSDMLGSRGAFLITAGLYLHVYVSALLMPIKIIDKTGQALLGKPRFLKQLRQRFARGSHPIEFVATEVLRPPLVTKKILLICYGCTVVISLNICIQMMNVYPLFAAERGTLRYTIAASLSCLSGIDFCGRLTSGFIVDKLRNPGRLRLIALIFLQGGAAVFGLAWFECALPMVIGFVVSFGLVMAQMSTAWIPILVGFTDVGHSARATAFILMGVGMTSVGSVFMINEVVRRFHNYIFLVVAYGGGMWLCAASFFTLAILFPGCAVNMERKGNDSCEDLNWISSNHSSST